MQIFCCGCDDTVQASLTDGSEIYPHRKDLHALPFWKCEACGNFVGCHYKSSNKTKPLGCIPTPELKKARQKIHSVLDPIWKSGKMKRKDLYSALSEKLGWEYHTAEIISINDAELILSLVKEYA